MKTLVELVNRWNEFDNLHPNSGIDDFCRYYLIQKRESTANEQMVGGIIPPFTDALLAKLLGRISLIHDMLSRIALSKLDIQIEWYYFLQSIYKLKEVRKTELIQHNLAEYSTGMSILDKLKGMGYITEHDDPGDNRAKLIRITEMGEKQLQKCHTQLGKVVTLIFGDLLDEDKKLIIHLLKDVEIKYSKLVYKAKQQDFESFIKEQQMVKSAEAGI